MIRYLTLFAFLLTAAACSKPEKDIVGRWAVDLEALSATAGKDLKGDDKKKAVELAKKVASQMSYEFAEGGKLNVTFGQVRRVGTYKVKSSSGKTLTVATTLKEGEAEKSAEVKIELLGKGKIEITAPDGKAVKFVKQGR